MGLPDAGSDHVDVNLERELLQAGCGCVLSPCHRNGVFHKCCVNQRELGREEATEIKFTGAASAPVIKKAPAQTHKFSYDLARHHQSVLAVHQRHGRDGPETLGTR